MDVEPFATPGVEGRDHEGLTVHREADVADEALVQDGRDRLPVVMTPLGQPADRGA